MKDEHEYQPESFPVEIESSSDESKDEAAPESPQPVEIESAQSPEPQPVEIETASNVFGGQPIPEGMRKIEQAQQGMRSEQSQPVRVDILNPVNEGSGQSGSIGGMPGDGAAPGQDQMPALLTHIATMMDQMLQNSNRMVQLMEEADG